MSTKKQVKKIIDKIIPPKAKERPKVRGNIFRKEQAKGLGLPYK